jgi:hypothetical protein
MIRHSGLLLTGLMVAVMAQGCTDVDPSGIDVVCLSQETAHDAGRDSTQRATTSQADIRKGMFLEPDFSVEVIPNSASVEITQTISVEAVVTGFGSKQVAWYVDNVYGGNPDVGTITQSNPALYTAPDGIVFPDEVVVKAVSLRDTTKVDGCAVEILFTVVHVSALSGDDGLGSGGAGNPVRSITRGLEIAGPGMTVQVASGTYDHFNGEVFPITVGDDISLIGESLESTVIQGHGVTGYNSAIHLTGNSCRLRGFTVRPGPDDVTDCNILIYVGSCQSAAVESIRVYERARYSVLRVQGAVNTLLEDCNLVIGDGTRSGRGFELAMGDRGTILRKCVVSGFDHGLFFNYGSDAMIEGCTVEGNSTGLWLYGDSSPNPEPNPDLGGGARGSGGGNTIRDNSACGLLNGTANAIYARFNAWTCAPPVEGVDYCNSGTGTVITE